MHELAITESIVAGVSECANGSRVIRVMLHVGKLSGVVPDAVRFCFDVCCKGTALEGAELQIVEIEGRARCRDCGREIEIDNLIALCACGSADLEVLSGEELKIKEVEVL